jgi:integrase/recombinase XerC
MTAVRSDALTLDDLRAMIGHRPDLIQALSNEVVKDKSYQEFPMGQEVAAYLRAKRKRLTDASYRSYESSLDKLARHFPYLELKDFEPPVGTERIEEFLDDRWGQDHTPGTYNVNHAIVSDFFKWQVRRGRMNATPMTAVDKARKRDIHREVFTNDSRRAIIAAQPSLRDRLALRLLFDYGLRKGALQKVQFKHFDHQRRRLTIFTKGAKVREIPMPDPPFWRDLERHILDEQAEPHHFLMCLVKPVPFGSPDEHGRRRTREYRFSERMMSMTALHRWWYRRLELAGIVAVGDTSGEKMHKARHTAGQNLLDSTGDLKLVQKLLGHKSIQTTGDTYVDYDSEQWAAKMAEALRKNDDE